METLTRELAEEIATNLKKYANIITQNSISIKLSPSNNRKTGMVRNNLRTIKSSAECLTNSPTVLSPAVNSDEWNAAISLFELTEIIRPALFLFDTAVNNSERASAEIIFDDFNSCYRMIKLYSDNGLPEAMQIYSIMKVIYDHLRGNKDISSHITQLEKAVIAQANKVIFKYKDEILKILKAEALLAKNLTENIKQVDDELKIKN